MTKKQHSDNLSTSVWIPPSVADSLATLDFQLYKSGYAIDYYEDGSFLSVRYVKGKCEGNGYLIKDNVLLRLIQFENGNVVNSQVVKPIRILLVWIQANDLKDSYSIVFHVELVISMMKRTV